MERIILTLPGELLREIDAVAERLERKRSRVIREALTEWLEIQRRREIEALLEESYRTQAAELEQLAADFQGAEAEAGKTLWRWDA